MFSVNEVVIKANHGVCMIKDIVKLPNVDKNRNYYYLVPVDDENMKVYVPVDMGNEVLHYVMNEKEAMECIAQFKNIDAAWIKNEKQREIFYKEAMKSCDPIRLVSIIKNMYERKQMRIAGGKKPIALDEKYFCLAEEQLFSELAFALNKDKSEMLDFIQANLNR